CSSYAGSNMLF
nr:immunoglobulin light chain junction region [Macaca mulatta]MPO04628.1 immunoglobulin light chain junction region [Macaca mulatta]MPO04744.1 immunoglobulin light chain junction region [Macaca mulatta]MPO05041.1 immunoglobulin light chain junction region [Macaca mulatta]MPO06470.1 immunoglobulin light chain junction region [Macaca mulatta]